MKDILKIMRFDFLTAMPFAAGAVAAVIVFCFLLSTIVSPIINSYAILVSMSLVIPLQQAADKNGFNKLYGILPVKKKNITRARFLYIFSVHFTAELTAALLSLIALNLRLYRLLPDTGNDTVQLIKANFADTRTLAMSMCGIFLFLCLIFSYMEMMGQIFGRENEFRIILITLTVITVLAMGFFVLSDKEIIPRFKLPDIPQTASEFIPTGILLHFVLFGTVLLFGETTANVLAKREL